MTVPNMIPRVISEGPVPLPWHVVNAELLTLLKLGMSTT